MVEHNEILEYIKVGTGCIIILGLAGYVIFYLKPPFEQILQLISYIAVYLFGYISSKRGKKR